MATSRSGGPRCSARSSTRRGEAALSECCLIDQHLNQRDANDENSGSRSEDIESTDVWPCSSRPDVSLHRRVASHVRASGISGAGPAVDSFETRSRRLSLGLRRDHAWIVPPGLISVQSVRGTDGGALFCGGLPRQHRSIYRAPRCVWPEHRYGAARPSLLSAPSCCMGALVYGRLAIRYRFVATVCRKRYCENGALEVDNNAADRPIHDVAFSSVNCSFTKRSPDADEGPGSATAGRTP